MPSVDERVVELEFDNKDFGSRVQQTIGDLKSLDHALQLGGSAAGVKEVSNAIGKMNINPLVDAAESVSNKFSVMRVVATAAINRITNAAMDMGKKLIGAVPNKIIQGGWNRALNISKAQFTLQGIMREGDSWEVISQNINDSVTGTAYSFDAAALAASSFYASGIKQGDEMYQSLRAVAGVAAMTSSDYSDIARIFTTVSGNGRLMSEQLNQISARGLNAAATLADQLHVSEAEVREMVSAGEISFKEFSDAMYNAFGEHAAKANETFTGALDNMKGALARIGAEFADPLQKGLIPVINATRTWLLSIKDLTDKFVAPFSKLVDIGSKFTVDVLGKMEKFFQSDAVVNKVQGLADNLTKLFDGIGQQINPTKALGVDDWAKISDAPYIDMLKEKLIEVASASDESFKAMYDSYGSFEESLASGWLTKDIFMEAANGLKEMSENMDSVGESSQDAAAYLEEMWKYAKQVERGDWGNGQERYDRLTEAGLSYHDIQGLVNHDLLGWDYTLEGLTTTLKESGKYTDEQIAALEAFAAELEDGGSSLQDFISAFDSFDKMTTFQYISESLSNIFNFATKIGSTLWDSFREAFSFDGEGLKTIPDLIHRIAGAVDRFTAGLDANGIISGFTRVFSSNIFQAIRNFADGIGNIIGVIKQFAAAASAAFTKVFDGGETKQVKFLGVILKISVAIRKVSEAFKAFTEGASLDSGAKRGIFKAFTAFFTFIKSIGRSVQRVISAIGESFGNVLTALSPLGGLLFSVIGRFTDATSGASALEIVLGALETVIGVIAGAFIALSDALGPVVEYFVGWVESTGIVEKAMDAISGAVSKAQPVISSALGTIRDKFAQFAPIVKEKLAGVPDAIKNVFSKIRDHIDPIGEQLSGAFGGLKDSAFGKIGEAFTGFIDAMADGQGRFDAFVEIFKTTFEGLVETVESVVEKVKGFKDSIKNALSGIADPVNDAAGAISGATDSVSGVFDRLSTGATDVTTTLGPGIEYLIEIFEGLAGLVKDLSGKSFDELFSYFSQGVALVGMFQYIAAFRDMAAALKGFSGSLKGISTMFKPATSAIDGIKGSITAARPGKFFEFAAGIAAIALSLYLVSTIPIEDLGKAFGFLAGMVALMAAIIYVIPAIAGKLVKPDDLVKIDGMAAAMIAMAGAVFLLALTARLLKGVSADDIGKLVGLMIALGAAVAAIGYATPGIATGAVSLLAFVAAIYLLIKPLKILATMDIYQLIQGLAALVFMMIALGAAVGIIGHGGASIGAAVAILAMAAAIFVLTYAVEKLGAMRWQDIAKGLGFLVIGFAAFVAILYILGVLIDASGGTVAAGLVAFGGGALLLAAAVFVLVGALWLLTQIDFEAFALSVEKAVAVFARMEGVDKAAEVITKLGSAAIVAGIGLILLGVGAALVGLGMLALAAGLGLLGVVAPLAAGGIVMISGVMPAFSEGCKAAAEGLLPLGGALIVAGLGAVVAAAGIGLLSLALILAGVAAIIFAGSLKLASMILGGDLLSAIAQGAQSAFPAVQGIFSNIGKGLMDALSGGGEGGGMGAGKNILSGFADNIRGGLPDINGALDGVKTAITGKLGSFDFSAMAGEKGAGIPLDFMNGVDLSAAGMPEELTAILGPDGTALSGLANGDYSAMTESLGIQIPDGMMSGAESGLGDFQAMLGESYGVDGEAFASLDPSALYEQASAYGVEIPDGLVSSISGGEGEVAAASASVPETVSSNLGDGSEGSQYGEMVAAALQASMGALTASATALVTSVKSSMAPLGPQMSTTGTESATKFASSMRAQSGAARSGATALSTSAKSGMSTLASTARSIGSRGGSMYASGVRSQTGAASSSGHALSSSASSGAASGSGTMYSHGRNHAQGFLNGLTSLMGSISSAAARISRTVADATSKAGQVRSPSRVMMRIGAYFTEGFVNGLTKDMGSVKAAGDAIVENLVPAMSKVNDIVQDAAASDFDINPSITPIVDLDNIKAASSYVNSAFGGSYGLGLGSSLNRYGLYGDPTAAASKSVVNNVSVTVQYQAGSDVNAFASNLASVLTAKMNLEA